MPQENRSSLEQRVALPPGRQSVKKRKTPEEETRSSSVRTLRPIKRAIKNRCGKNGMKKSRSITRLRRFSAKKNESFTELQYSSRLIACTEQYYKGIGASQSLILSICCKMRQKFSHPRQSHIRPMSEYEDPGETLRDIHFPP